jgi:hypothetical protein
MIEEERGTVRAVAWSELFPWLILVRCFRISIGMRPLLIAAAAALVTVCGWWAIEYTYSGNEDIGKRLENRGRCPWESLASVAGEAGTPLGNFSPWGDRNTSITQLDANPITGTWSHLSRPFRESVSWNLHGSEQESELVPQFTPPNTGDSAESPEPIKNPFQASKMAYSLLCAFWALLVWAFAGAAVTRDAALQLTVRERSGWGGLIGHARARWKAYVWAPLLPFLAILAAMFCMALLGIVMKLNLGILIAGIVWPLLLMAGFLMVLLSVGLLFGWPFMFATISVEGTDSFDALSRAYSYVYQRPLQLLFYVGIVTALGMLGWVFVYSFANAVLALTQGAVCWGSGGQFVWEGETIPYLDYLRASGEQAPGLGWIGVLLIRAWSDGVRILAVGYLFSYFWVAATAVYLLLRCHVDDTELDDVYVEEVGEEVFGLPDIKQDSAGAPVVEDEKPLDETE